MKGWIALLLTAVLLCQLEPVYAVLHQNLPWLPETPPIELPRFYLTREDAVRSREKNDGNSGPEEDQPVMAEPSPEDEWALLLVNVDHPIDREFCPELEVIQPGEPYQADARIVDDLRAMMEAARQDGVDLLICSAYRSYDQQAYNLQRSSGCWKTPRTMALSCGIPGIRLRSPGSGSSPGITGMWAGKPPGQSWSGASAWRNTWRKPEPRRRTSPEPKGFTAGNRCGTSPGCSIMSFGRN